MDEHSNDLVVFYGTLLGHYSTQDIFGIRDHFEFLEDCSFSARLYDQGEYPFVLLGGGTVYGELYRVLDKSAWQQLHEWEEYYPENHEESQYLLREIELIKPVQTKALVYEWNSPLQGQPEIVSGRWDKPEEEIEHWLQ